MALKIIMYEIQNVCLYFLLSHYLLPHEMVVEYQSWFCHHALQKNVSFQKVQLD
jgi:hypothetical protein